MSNILLIEDNEAIIMGLEYLFTNNGYNVRVARSAYQAKEILDNAKDTEKYRTLIGAGDVWNIDIVILDVMLPDGDGFSLCRKIKADDIAPVIFLTAKDEEKDVVMGLELGADDYVIKPFRNMELLSRIKNVLRRNRSGNELTFADLKMDVDIRKLYKADNEVKLTKLEFEILKILLQNPKKVFTREEKRAWLDQMQDVALGSDAFFPFGDNIERAHRSGVAYVAQPGGSIRDQQVIDTCNANKKPFGIFVGTTEAAREYRDLGASYIAIASDLAFMAKGYHQMVDELKK